LTCENVSLPLMEVEAFYFAGHRGGPAGRGGDPSAWRAPSSIEERSVVGHRVRDSGVDRWGPALGAGLRQTVMVADPAQPFAEQGGAMTEPPAEAHGLDWPACLAAPVSIFCTGVQVAV
jgi:hypothetical protein